MCWLAESQHLNWPTGNAACLIPVTNQEAHLLAPRDMLLTAQAPCRVARLSAEDPH